MGLIKKFFLTGDTHGRVVERLETLKSKYPDLKPAETALIILGDAGLNFYLNNSDYKNKKQVNDMGYIVYCLRGNHEERPENISGMTIMVDHDIHGEVYVESMFSNIRYLMDGNVYDFGIFKTLCIGGAYSVDKWYRLQNFRQSNGWCGWFAEEQLFLDEMNYITKKVKNNYFDFVLTHTCPRYWEPTDLFIGGIDQSAVDKSMEDWLDRLKDQINFTVWCFGHYHADRTEDEGVEQYFYDIEELTSIWDRTLDHIPRNLE